LSPPHNETCPAAFIVDDGLPSLSDAPGTLTRSFMQRVRRKRIMMLSLVGLTAFLALLAVVRGTYHITIDELLGADTLGRIMFGSGALPVGIITSFMGAPMFLYLLIRSKGTPNQKTAEQKKTMKFKSVLGLLLVLIISAANVEGMIVKDMAGRPVSLTTQPQRIVCIGPGALRLIVYLEAQNMLVGVESMEKQHPAGRPYWIAQPHLQALPVIGPGGSGAINKKPDMEAVLRVAPDLIVATYMETAMADEVSGTLGIPVVVLSYGELAVFDQRVFDSLRLAGKILNREARADAVIDFINGIRTDLDRRTADVSDQLPVKVFVGGIGYRGSQGIESTQRDYIPLDWNHTVNAAQQVQATVGSHVMVDKEILLELDPDVIFIDGGGLDLVKADYRRKPDFYPGADGVPGRAYLRTFSVQPLHDQYRYGHGRRLCHRQGALSPAICRCGPGPTGRLDLHLPGRPRGGRPDAGGFRPIGPADRIRRKMRPKRAPAVCCCGGWRGDPLDDIGGTGASISHG
jgi:iron complex transport system substrate-binding protein